jgi:glycosyltransferase involved in cell wall biosynthesis
MEAEGFRVIPWRISRRSLNPLRELNAFFQVVRAYKRERPDLVHHVALKPIVYGGLAARLCGWPASVNAITGMGHVFTNSNWRMRLLRKGLLMVLRIALGSKNSKTVFQNEDNRTLLIRAGVVPLARTTVIRGTGVNVEQFVPQREATGPPVVVLASRLLWEKGIADFVEAARILRTQRTNARFVLVGKPDPENPSSIPEAQIRAWVESHLVEWWGHHDEMAKVFAKASVVCLPSYGEGFPRVLVEAAACGRAIVSTDVPGCREVVRNGENGFLVPARNPRALARALDTLIRDPILRSNMAGRGREIALREFSEEMIFAEILSVYRELLGFRWASNYPLVCKQDEVVSESNRQ